MKDNLLCHLINKTLTEGLKSTDQKVKKILKYQQASLFYRSTIQPRVCTVVHFLLSMFYRGFATYLLLAGVKFSLKSLIILEKQVSS